MTSSLVRRPKPESWLVRAPSPSPDVPNAGEVAVGEPVQDPAGKAVAKVCVIVVHV